MVVLVAPATAAARVETKTYTTPAVEVKGYQVKQDAMFLGDGLKPDEDAYITKMEVELVDANHKPIPISRLMLHHIVFLNAGIKDATCNTFTSFDESNTGPAGAERFYAAGEERAKLTLPPGYGYPISAARDWIMTFMLMNHRRERDTAFIEYKVTYDTEPKVPVRPYWLDVRNCMADPVYDVPGGGRVGSTHRERSDFTMPESGRIVAGGGHVHGGAKNLTISQPDCGNRKLYASRPTWGSAGHPFYKVKPILHEPGPINMSGFNSANGFPVAKGERLRLTSNYDNALTHTRVMGISVIYVAPDAAADQRCAPRPTDVQDDYGMTPGRFNTPRFTVPLTGLGPDGLARTIERPPGATVKLPSGSTINARNFYFDRPNVSVRQGAKLRWKFSGELHNVTVANGPRGFGSPNMNNDREYVRQFDTPGTYKLFCALHPVDMTETVTVRGKRR